MEIIGVGTDIIDLDRLQNADRLDRLVDFFFLPEEIAKIPKRAERIQYIGSRIAAKEAVIKAYPGELHYHDLTIGKRGKKIEAGLLRKKDKNFRVFVSIAHEFSYAVAYATITTSS